MTILKKSLDIIANIQIGDIIDLTFVKKFRIINLGNICFINTFLQIILYYEFFINHFYSYRDKYIYNSYSISNKFFNKVNCNKIVKKQMELNIIIIVY